MACDARGDALWPAAVRITLLLDADLPQTEQARYTLTLGAPQPELDLPGGDRPEMAARAKGAEGAERAAGAEGAEGGGVAAPTLRVTTCTAGGDAGGDRIISGGDHAGDRISARGDGADTISTSISRELPISHEEASEALAYVRRRADELGRSWVS